MLHKHHIYINLISHLDHVTAGDVLLQRLQKIKLSQKFMDYTIQLAYILLLALAFDRYAGSSYSISQSHIKSFFSSSVIYIESSDIF